MEEGLFCRRHQMCIKSNRPITQMGCLCLLGCFYGRRRWLYIKYGIVEWWAFGGKFIFFSHELDGMVKNCINYRMNLRFERLIVLFNLDLVLNLCVEPGFGNHENVWTLKDDGRMFVERTWEREREGLRQSQRK